MRAPRSGRGRAFCVGLLAAAAAATTPAIAGAAVTPIVDCRAPTTDAGVFSVYFGYVKDARKQALDVDVTVIPLTASLTVGAQFQFMARVGNGPRPRRPHPHRPRVVTAAAG